MTNPPTVTLPRRGASCGTDTAGSTAVHVRAGRTSGTAAPAGLPLEVYADPVRPAVAPGPDPGHAASAPTSTASALPGGRAPGRPDHERGGLRLGQLRRAGRHPRLRRDPGRELGRAVDRVGPSARRTATPRSQQLIDIKGLAARPQPLRNTAPPAGKLDSVARAVGACIQRGFGTGQTGGGPTAGRSGALAARRSRTTRTRRRRRSSCSSRTATTPAASRGDGASAAALATTYVSG